MSALFAAIIASLSSPPVAAPAPAPAPSGAAIVSGTFADSTPFSVTLTPGQRNYLVPGNIHRGSAVFHDDGKSVCLENGYLGTTGDITGTFTIAVNGTQLASDALTIYPYTRARPYWVTAPTLASTPDLSMFPKLGSGSGSASFASAYAAADNSRMGRGLSDIAMETQGERADLGPLPAWDACYLTNPSTANANVVRGMADSAAVWQFHMIDPATQRMVDMSSNPHVSDLGVLYGQSGNPIVTYTTTNEKTMLQAQAHATAFSALACAIYGGTSFDKEELAMWANYTSSIWQSWDYRQSSGCVTTQHTQPRGTARGLTTLLYAAKLSGMASYFEPWIEDIASFGSTYWLSLPGIQIDPANVDYQIPNNAAPINSYAPWQQNLLIYALGQAISAGYKAYQPLLDFFVPPALDSMLVTKHEFATKVAVAAVDASGTPLANWVAALNETGRLLPDTVGLALTYAENSLDLITTLTSPDSAGYQAGDFVGYPWAPDGYPAMMQPALAMMVNHATDSTRAAAAWSVFQAHQRIDYSANPKYNVVPN